MKDLSTSKVRAMVFSGNYIVTDTGRVFRINPDTGQPISERKIYLNNCGYGAITIRVSKNKLATYMIHRLVWTCFNGEIPKGKEIDHINKKKMDNRLSNLRLLTRQENILRNYINNKKAKRYMKKNGKYVGTLVKMGKRIKFKHRNTKDEARKDAFLWLKNNFGHLMTKSMKKYIEGLH